MDKGSEGSAAQKGQQPGTKMVPERDLLALKGAMEGRLEKETRRVAELTEQVSLLQAREQERQVRGEVENLPEGEQLGAIRKRTLEERLALQKERAALEKEKEGIQAQVLEVMRGGVAKEYGVGLEVVASAATKEQAELLSLRFLREKGTDGSQPIPGAGADLGAGGVTGSSELSAHDKVRVGIGQVFKKKGS